MDRMDPRPRVLGAKGFIAGLAGLGHAPNLHRRPSCELYGPYGSLTIVATLARTRTGVPKPAAVDYDATMPYARHIGSDGKTAIEAILAQQIAFWPVLRG